MVLAVPPEVRLRAGELHAPWGGTGNEGANLHRPQGGQVLCRLLSWPDWLGYGEGRPPRY
jgi:hypothetical protein